MPPNDSENADGIRILHESYQMGCSLELYESQNTFSNIVTFEDAAASIYAKNMILIGYRS